MTVRELTGRLPWSLQGVVVRGGPGLYIQGPLR